MKIKQMRIVIAILAFIAVLVAAPVASANSPAAWIARHTPANR
jgi:hypothetical protein